LWPSTCRHIVPPEPEKGVVKTAPFFYLRCMEESQGAKQSDAMDVKQAHVALLEALRNEPSKYKVEVIVPDTLPEQLQRKSHITFTIKPPTFAVLNKIAQVVAQLPDELFTEQAMSRQALTYIPQLIEITAIMAHGPSKKPMPDWYVPFLTDNLTVQEVLQLWFEVAQKIQTGFFLPFFQTVRQMNPLSNINDSIPTP